MDRIQNTDGLTFLKQIDKNSVDLVLTDPPYITSRDSGMDKHAKVVKKFKETKQNTKTEAEWNKLKTEQQWNSWFDERDIQGEEPRKNKLEELKEKFLKYGSIYGKKYAVVTDYGEWDSKFTIEELEQFINEYYRVLRDGGTLILFFDLWKITILKEIMEKAKFKQIRFIEWIKTNPQPLNSKTNYLTNCREIALLGVKKGKPTFNSQYDNAIYDSELYRFPFQSGKSRVHPTQKSLKLFEELIKKHSNEGNLVLDTFLGSGTTALAAKNTNRKYKGSEVSEKYYKHIMSIL